MPKLSEFFGRQVYLDTMILYGFSRGIDNRLRDFMQRIELGDVQAHTSVLTFDELAYRLLLAFIKDRFDGSPLDRLRANEHEMLAMFAPVIGPHLNQLRSFPHLVVVDIRTDDLEVMIEAMTDHYLRPRDALHYAVMRRLGCLNLASDDGHFDAIPDIVRYGIG